jgi:hypothetical protein
VGKDGYINYSVNSMHSGNHQCCPSHLVPCVGIVVKSCSKKMNHFFVAFARSKHQRSVAVIIARYSVAFVIGVIDKMSHYRHAAMLRRKVQRSVSKVVRIEYSFRVVSKYALDAVRGCQFGPWEWV